MSAAEPPPPPPKSRSVDPLIGAVVAERFQVVAALGTGATARVYLALQQPMGRQVALKIIRYDLDPFQKREFGSRFLREASLAGRLSHPNVVTIYDFGYDEDGEGFIAMEFLRGRSLNRLLKEEAPLAPERAARLAGQIASGLRHAHAHGLVHRDVKPSNVFLVEDDGGEELAKLLDFGLVKETRDAVRSTGAGLVMGTPQYLAPEQAQGLEIDGRADLYALGCIFYRALTGVLPFEADNPLSIALMHVNEPYPPMVERAPEVPVDPALEEIVRRCMAKDPADRWADAAALVAALDGWRRAADAPPSSGATLAIPEQAPPRRWPMALGAAALLAAVGFGGWSLTQRGAERDAPPELAMVVDADAIEVADAAAPGGSTGDATTASSEENPGSQAPEDGSQAPDAAPGSQAPEAAPGPKPTTRYPSSRDDRPTAGLPAAPIDTTPISSTTPDGVEIIDLAPDIPDELSDAAPKPADASAGAEPEAPPSEPAPEVKIAVDEVLMTRAQADRVLAFVNDASEQQLRDAGLYSRGITPILQRRPFTSIQDFAATPYVGEKSVRAALAAAP